MKKLFAMAIMSAITLNANAQADQMKELACKGFNEAIEKSSKNTQNPKQNIKSATWIKLAEAYIDHATQCGADSSASVKAYETYQKALEIEKAAGGKKTKEIQESIEGPSKLYGALMNQGAAYYNTKNMQMAGKLFNLSLNLNKKDTTAALYAGIVDQTLQRNSEAINSFNTFLNNGGKDPAVFYSLAQILKIEKKYDEAISLLRRGVALNPKDKDLKSEIINTYIVSNNIDGAIADLEKLSVVEPGNVTTLTNLGLLYDNRAGDMTIEINKVKDKIEKSSTLDLSKKIELEKEKLGIFETEIDNLTAKLKKEPKTALATKKRIAEVTSQKVAQGEIVDKLNKELTEKQANKGAAEELITKLAPMQEKQKHYKEKALTSYKKVLEIDANNFDVNFNMAVMYFNEAVETKKTIDAMDMKTYQKDGKEIEKIACKQFNDSKPYFDKCKSINANDEMVNENLKNLENILAQCK
jgi:tetratricopeptide (TPR) repeat protein